MPGALYILNPGAQISKAEVDFYATRGATLKSGAQYCRPPGAGFFIYVSPGGGTCQVMHSGAELRILPIIWYSSKKSNAGILLILMCLVLI